MKRDIYITKNVISRGIIYKIKADIIPDDEVSGGFYAQIFNDRGEVDYYYENEYFLNLEDAELFVQKMIDDEVDYLDNEICHLNDLRSKITTKTIKQ